MIFFASHDATSPQLKPQGVANMAACELVFPVRTRTDAQGLLSYLFLTALLFKRDKAFIFTFINTVYHPIPIWMPPNEPDRNTRRRIEDILRSDECADLYAARDVRRERELELQ